jgi:hypothetical protein
MVAWVESKILVRLHTPYDAVNSTMKGVPFAFIGAPPFVAGREVQRHERHSVRQPQAISSA